jgi:hypothetical protein
MFMDYFGEPTFAVIFGIANFVPALSLWLFGVYGYQIGLIGCLATVLLIRKVMLTFLYMSAWTNTTLDPALIAKRKLESRKLRLAAAPGGGSGRPTDESDA